MQKTLQSFPKKSFVELRSLPSFGGAYITNIDLAPAAVFELLEVIYGPYQDLMSKFVFIDDKTTWERLFKTRAGVLRIYDFKGNTSIGYGSPLNKNLSSQARRLKLLLESLWPRYLSAKKKALKKEIKKSPTNNFLRTFFATHALLAQSREVGSFLEGLVLLASITDAQLRYGTLMLRILQNRTTNSDTDLIYQKNKTYLSERKVQKIALTEGFISLTQCKELSHLYDARNRAVHRYFISDFEYAELPKILGRYEKIREQLGNKLSSLEKKLVPSLKEKKLDLDALRKMITEGKLKIDSKRPSAVLQKRKFLFPREFGAPSDIAEID